LEPKPIVVFSFIRGRLVSHGLGLLDRSLNPLQVVVTVINDHNMPAVGFKSLGNIFGKGAVGVAVNGNVIIIIDGNEVTELEMSCHGGSLTGHTLHHASVAQEDIGVVIDQVEAGLVEYGSGVSLGHGKANSICKALSKWPSCNFNAFGIMRFRVAGGSAVNRLYAEFS
jgi:hypothetical protein